MQRFDRSRVIQKAARKRPAEASASTPVAERCKKRREEPRPAPPTEDVLDVQPISVRREVPGGASGPTPVIEAVDLGSDSDTRPLADLYPEREAEASASAGEAATPAAVETDTAEGTEAAAAEAGADNWPESDTVIEQDGTERWKALNDPRLARCLLRGAITDADWEVSVQRDILDVPGEMYRDILRTIHGASLMEDAVRHVVQTAKGSARRVCELEAILEAAEASQRSAEEALAEARAEVTCVRVAKNKVKERLTTCRTRLEKRKERITRLSNRLEKGEERLAAAKEQTEGAQAEAEAARAEARRWEALWKESEESAPVRALEAVEAYRASDAFVADAEEVAADFYREGYTDALKRLKELYPTLDLTGAELRAEQAGSPEKGGTEDQSSVEDETETQVMEGVVSMTETQAETEVPPDVQVGAAAAGESGPPVIVLEDVEPADNEPSAVDRA